MKIRFAAVAGMAAVTLVLAGCGSGSDAASCRVVQGSYSDMVSVLDRWQYGNSPNSAMLDALQSLADDANGQASIARTTEFKSAAGDVGASAKRVYQAVNSGAGFDSAAGDLASASKALNALCSSLK